MKKINLSVAAAATLALFASCSDGVMSTADDIVAPIQEEEATTPSVAVYLTNKAGSRVSTLDGQFGIYNLHIEGAEAWIIENNDAFVSLSETRGTGDAIVPVYVATCWGEDRTMEMVVKTLDLDAITRSDEGNGVATTQLTMPQGKAYTTNYISRYGSNMGTGYAYDPARSNDLLMAIGQPVFDIQQLCRQGYIDDCPNYEQHEVFYLEDSEQKLHDKLNIEGGLSFKFGTVAAQGAGGYGSVYDTDESSWHCMMSNRTILFQRDLKYLDVIYSDNQCLSAGFKYSQSQLESELGKASDLNAVKKAVDAFFANYGPFLINRSQMGVELDYTGTIHKSVTTDSTMVKAAIKFKYEKEVVEPKKEVKKEDTGDKDKDDEGEEEPYYPDDDPSKAVERFFAENAPASTGKDKDKDTIDISGEGEYEKVMTSLSNSTSAKLEIKGGTASISILANGGKIDSDQLYEWHSNVTTDNATLVKFNVVPIYILFNETAQPKAYKYLKQYSEEGEIKSL